MALHQRRKKIRIFGADADKPGSKVGSVFSFGPETAKSPQAALSEEDGYASGFENSGEFKSPKAIGAGQPEADLPHVAERAFSFSGNQEDIYGEGFEEQEEVNVLGEPQPQSAKVAIGVFDNTEQPASIHQEFSFGGSP